MRYYTETKLPSNILYLCKSYLNTTIDEQWILTCEGLYKYVNNQLHKFKLWLSEHEFPPTTLNIKPSNMRWIKTETVYKTGIAIGNNAEEMQKSLHERLQAVSENLKDKNRKTLLYKSTTTPL